MWITNTHIDHDPYIYFHNKAVESFETDAPETRKTPKNIMTTNVPYRASFASSVSSTVSFDSVAEYKTQLSDATEKKKLSKKAEMGWFKRMMSGLSTI